MKAIRVPYGMSVHGIEEIRAVKKVLKTSTQMGSQVKQFENKISKIFNKKYGLMVNSGSSALLLALKSLNLPKGSEVITPALTFATTVASIVQNDLVPIFVDVEKTTYCIDVNQIEQMLSNKTKCILVPNLIGNLPNWEKIKRISNKFNLITIEDSADALGSKYKKKSTGFYSDISITSFYGSHIINCAGNGGLVSFNNKSYYQKAKLLRSWGRDSSLFDESSEKIENRFNKKIDHFDYDAKFIFSEIGYNLEPSEMGAAFGLVQLKKLNNNIKIRNKNLIIHNSYFKKYSDYFYLPSISKYSRTGLLAYPLQLKEQAPFSRKDLQIFLEKKNIQTRVIFTGNILRQPGFKKIRCRISKKGYPNSDRVMKNGLLIAIHHGLNKKMINHIHNSFELFIKKYQMYEKYK